MEAHARHGLIIGKFLPPHAGHLHLVHEASRRCERLTVLVCTLESEPIGGAKRFEWMRALCPDAHVVHVTDENPQYPDEHPEFWNIWRETIERNVDRPVDVVFTSETYGDELAQSLGAVHECIDPGRGAHPVSGTAIRENPRANWKYIPEIVRPDLVKRVVVTGSECTGKTTLAPLLADRLGTTWSAEYGREFVALHGMPAGLSDVEAIARGQIDNEDRAAAASNGLLILDTDLLSTVVYSRHYYGDVPQWIADAAAERRADLYLLSGIDVPWEADGDQRDRPHMREEMQQLFRDELQRQGATFVELSGSIEERLLAALEAIERYVRL